MNEIGQSFKEQFIDRLAELGIILNVDYTLTCSLDDETDSDWVTRLDSLGKDPSYYYVTRVIVDSEKSGKTYRRLVIHAVMGMIYHFSSRKWITNQSYCYIMKDMHSLKFQDDNDKTD